MNRATTKRLTSKTDIGSGNETWETPPAVYRKLEHDFGPFGVDLCANEVNHLNLLWFGPGSPLCESVFTAEWMTYARTGFANPVYGTAFLRPLYRRCCEFADLGFTTTVFVPFRWNKLTRDVVFNGLAQMWICDKRITFWQDGAPRFDKKGDPMPAMFDQCILQFGGVKTPTERAILKSEGAVIRRWSVPDHIYVD
jgi:hypothetical protein